MTSWDARALGQEDSKGILKKEKNRVACGGGYFTTRLRDHLMYDSSSEVFYIDKIDNSQAFLYVGSR